MSKNRVISPIAIDLGAKYTGAFFAHYEEGSTLDKINPQGKVYQLDKDKHTYLMQSRTARRHQKRGYDRRQMAKRLLKLIWEQELKLPPWDENKDIQQTISFLMNRRGFSYLAEQYDPDALRDMPVGAKERICDALRLEESKDELNLDEKLIEWAREGEGKVGDMYNRIRSKTNSFMDVKGEIGRIEKLCRYCEPPSGGNTNRGSKKPYNVPRTLLAKWKQNDIQGLPDSSGEWIDIAAYLDEHGQQAKDTLLGSLNSRGYLNALKNDRKKLEKSEWGFNPTKFELEQLEKDENDEKQSTKTHLQHFAYALHMTLEELKSGGRHRSRYFDEIENVLKHKGHAPKYLKNFCDRLVIKKEFKPLDADSFKNLIGHISNLELKPLRKYFNSKEHKKADRWLLHDDGKKEHKNKDFTTIYTRWIRSEWRVGDKNTDKLQGKDYDYKELRKALNPKPEKQEPNKLGFNLKDGKTVTDFMLETKPDWTIPPYQDNNNRKPPRCQSLLLNVKFLDNNYPDWQKWLDSLRNLSPVKAYLGQDGAPDAKDYEASLRELTSGKNKNYFDNQSTGDKKKDSGRRSIKELNARVLQFILDRVKAEDPLNLNEIYSHVKKIRQNGGTEAKGNENVLSDLKKAITESKLPNMLKKEDPKGSDVFANKSFLHFVCAYYKQRQRAKDGRIFIHPKYRKVHGRGYEDTGHYDDEKSLLTYCNHKPRQKRYQMLGDIAYLLQVSPDDLRAYVQGYRGDKIAEKVINWLEGIDKLKANCDRASKEQKDRRGRLAQDIQRIYGLIRHRRREGDKRSDTRILQNSRVDDPDKLHKFCKRAKNLCNALVVDLNRHDDYEPVAAVFMLAQLNNIVFKNRQGYASTCAVCGADNAQRMRMVNSRRSSDEIAHAQRIPAISTRVIDGAVKRMARIVGNAMAEDKWQLVKSALKQGSKVRVPIIIESNQFEFEPSREELVKNMRISRRKGKPLERGGDKKIYDSRVARIQDGNEKGICPYLGCKIGDQGQIDHILPRASSYGTINDEANLIYASIEGNQRKQNEKYSLDHLDAEYKRSIFSGRTSAQEIEEWIVSQIGDGDGEDFSFGTYKSFINLELEQQKAFRHALFLDEDNELRKKVIRAISNRNRAFVNGTQRYFAEVLANKLHKMAKDINCERELSFDYFEVSANGMDGTYILRKQYEIYCPAIKKYEKEEKQPQKPYSHLLDAQLAFVIAADAHRNEGGLRLCLGDKDYKEPYKDANTGKVRGILTSILIGDGFYRLQELARKKPSDNFSSHRSYTRDTFYAVRYLPILLRKENGLVVARAGFDWQNSLEIKKKDEKNILSLTRLFNNVSEELRSYEYESLEDFLTRLETLSYFSNQLETKGYCCLIINRFALHKQWIESHNLKAGRPFDGSESKKFVYEKLGYKTEKKIIKEPEDIDACLGDEEKFTVTVNNNKVIIPVKKEWQRLKREWDKSERADFKLFLKKYFASAKKPSGQKTNKDSDQRRYPHQKVRKDFSLPVITQQGMFLIKRGSWNGSSIFQIQNDSDSRSMDNKPNVPVRRKDGAIGKRLAKWVESENIVKLSKDGKCEEGDAIEPTQWWKVQKSDEVAFPDGIEGIWYQVDNNTAPTIAVKLSGPAKSAAFLNDPLCQHGYREKRNSKKEITMSKEEVVDEVFQKQIKLLEKGDIFRYKGGKIISSKAFKKAFSTSIKVEQPE